MTLISEAGDFSVRKTKDDEYRVSMRSAVEPAFTTWVMTRFDLLNLADALIKAKEATEKEAKE